MEDLVKELNNHGAINTQEVYNLMNKYSNDKIKVSKEQIDILVKILDIDGRFLSKLRFRVHWEKIVFRSFE